MSNSIEISQDKANELLEVIKQLKASPGTTEGVKKENIQKATVDLGDAYQATQEATQLKKALEEQSKKFETLEALIKSKDATIQEQLLKIEKKSVESASPQAVAPVKNTGKYNLQKEIESLYKERQGDGVLIYKTPSNTNVLQKDNNLNVLQKDNNFAAQYAVGTIGSGLPENLAAISEISPGDRAIKGFVENRVLNVLEPVMIPLTAHRVTDPVEDKIVKGKEAGGFGDQEIIFDIYNITLDPSNNAKRIRVGVPDLMLVARGAASGNSLEQVINSNVVRGFDRQDAKTILTGSGKGEPKGILTYKAWSTSGVVTANSIDQRPGKFEKGALNTFKFSTANPAQPFLAETLMNFDLVALESDYANRASYVMNKFTYALIRTVNSDTRFHLLDHSVSATTGNPLPNPTGNLLFGKSVILDEVMPEPAVGAKAIIYGDLDRAYCYAEFGGLMIKIDRTPAGRQDTNDYFFTKYSDGAIKDFNALALIEISAP